MYRVAFNPALPVHAASPINVGGDVIAQDAEVNWRALDVSEHTLYDWWRAGLIYFVEAPVSAEKANGPVGEQLPTVAEQPTCPPVPYDVACTADPERHLSRRERRARR
jgi:hypothetical protein